MWNFKGYINGEFISTDSVVEIINPLDNSVAGTVAAMNEKDIANAFNVAKEKFKEYRKTTNEERIKWLNQLCDLLEENKKELATIMHAEIAKTIEDSIVEIERTIVYVQDTIKAWKELKYKQMKVGSKTANIHRVPLGVVLAVSPFNYPINLALSKIAPALLAGNTVVFKPATNGSLTGSYLTQLIDKTDLPKGAFNLVTGRGRDIGDSLTTNKNIAMITFTGSVRIGKNIAASQTMKPLVLELGGNDAAYIRNDADLDLASKEVAKGAFSYSGQRCTAIKRVIVHKDIKEVFINKLIEIVKTMKTNPLVTSSAASYVEELIKDSKDRGDHFFIEGKRVGNELPFHIVETDTNSRAWKEEAFGPLLPIVTIDDEGVLKDIFNDTEFGLQNSIFTTDIEWAKQLAIDLESGSVNINKSSSRGPDIFPFLGVKNSGFGTQGIKDALISMTRVLNIVEND